MCGPEEKKRGSANRRNKLIDMILGFGTTRMRTKSKSNCTGHLHGAKNKDVHSLVCIMSFADVMDRSCTAENRNAYCQARERSTKSKDQKRRQDQEVMDSDRR